MGDCNAIRIRSPAADHWRTKGGRLVDEYCCKTAGLRPHVTSALVRADFHTTWAAAAPWPPSHAAPTAGACRWPWRSLGASRVGTEYLSFSVPAGEACRRSTSNQPTLIPVIPSERRVARSRLWRQRFTRLQRQASGRTRRPATAPFCNNGFFFRPLHLRRPAQRPPSGFDRSLSCFIKLLRPSLL